MLNARLGELREAGLITQDNDRAHRLTPLGQDLYAALRPLQKWSERWVAEG